MKGTKIAAFESGLCVFLLLLLTTAGNAQELEAYLKIAAQNNVGLMAAKKDYQATLERIPQIKSLPDPSLSVSAFGKMEDARISLMQQLPWFGTLKAREDQASLLAQAQYQIYLDRQNELFFRVSQQYFRLYLLDERRKYEQENQQILKDLKELALARVRSAEGALADVLQVDQMWNQSESDLKVLELEERPVKARFNALLNREATSDVVLPDSLVMSDIPLVSLEDLEENPRVLEMDKRIAAAEHGVDVARKSGLPQLGLGLDFMVNQRMMMEEHGENVLMPTLSVSLPIFRKKYNAAQRRANLQQEGLELKREQLNNDLETEFQAVVFEAEKQRERLSLYEQQTTSSRQILSLLLSSYRNSEASFEQVLRIRQDLLGYQLQTAQARADYLIQLARITYLTGNSFE